MTIPRDRFNTENRERVGDILREAFRASDVDWGLQLTESVLARVHYIVHCKDGVPPDFDHDATEERLVKATRAWSDDLRVALVTELGERRGLASCIAATRRPSRPDTSPRAPARGGG